MYEINDRFKDTNGYILVYLPDHPKAIKSGSLTGYVYEHVLVAENQILDRPIKTGEVVHHLNKNRDDNSPDNLLILSGPMHAKLHSWLNNHTIIPNEKQQIRNETGCVRCKKCQTPINHGMIYCSSDCKLSYESKYTRPSKEELEKLVWEKPTTKLAEHYGVSDTAIAKLCKSYGIEKPPRGYWTKKEYVKD